MVGSQSVCLQSPGSTGTLAHELAREYPGLKVTVFDLPEVTEHMARLHPTGQQTEQVRFLPGKGSRTLALGSPLAHLNHVGHHVCPWACAYCARVHLCLCACVCYAYPCVHGAASVSATLSVQDPPRTPSAQVPYVIVFARALRTPSRRLSVVSDDL